MISGKCSSKANHNLNIGDLAVDTDIVQGGMGVGISLHRLAGTVAREGGIGLISTAQIGYNYEGFAKHPLETNLKAIGNELMKAREIAADSVDKKCGAIGFNIMVATRGYEDYVREAVRCGADIIVSGAGLPIALPGLIDEGMKLREESSDAESRKLCEQSKTAKTKFVPIVSSAKSATVILKMWDRKYKTTADAIVIEGPLAGGHLGFSYEDLHAYGADTDKVSETYDRDRYDEEIRHIIEVVREYEEKYNRKIPVIVAGGIYSHEDREHALSLGADGVQVGTRFVITFECDAPEAYKEAYIAATEKDIKITKSPVGMPGRAINNPFLQEVTTRQAEGICGYNGPCYLCLEHCDRNKIPYCITKALIGAVDGDEPHALLFCGANAYRATHLESVAEVMQDLSRDTGTVVAVPFSEN